MTAKTFEMTWETTAFRKWLQDSFPGYSWSNEAFSLARDAWDASHAAALEELARLKAPVEVAGIVARIDDELPSFDHALAPMGVASLLRDCRAALESLAAQNAAQAEEIAKITGHAEAMAVEIRASYWGGNPSTALAAYRRDYQEES